MLGVEIVDRPAAVPMVGLHDRPRSGDWKRLEKPPSGADRIEGKRQRGLAGGDGSAPRAKEKRQADLPERGPAAVGRCGLEARLDRDGASNPYRVQGTVGGPTRDDRGRRSENGYSARDVYPAPAGAGLTEVRQLKSRG